MWWVAKDYFLNQQFHVNAIYFSTTQVLVQISNLKSRDYFIDWWTTISKSGIISKNYWENFILERQIIDVNDKPSTRKSWTFGAQSSVMRGSVV